MAFDLGRRQAVVGGLSLAALGLSSCSRLIERYSYRLILEVEVGGRRYLGQGVREVVKRVVSAFPDQSDLLTSRTRGEAFWIDVPGKPTLFVILPALDGGFAHEWDPSRFLEAARHEREGATSARSKTVKLQEATLNISDLPGLVYFDAPGDSMSVKSVKYNQLDVVFGTDARIVRASVSRTSEDLSTGIEKKLPWFDEAIDHQKKIGSIVRIPETYMFSVVDFYSWEKF